MANEIQDPITINIGNVCDGAMIEAFDLKLAEVLANILDPNTEAKTKREIHLVLTLHPKDDRIQINTEFTCRSKLAGLAPAQSRMYMARDENGGLYALRDDPRQMNIFAAPKPPEAPAVIQFSSGGK